MNNQKPITVARYDFISAMTDLINNSNLPPFVVETILKDFYSDVKILAQQQLESDMERYKSSQNG